ncbi:hypothetical protein [Rhodoplanes roseus]|uniref:Uncharacterized protein n=1 Tax=Rhodoplanes roseus TaxID=29409 RepID=A0A327KS12_9BRAD|nr:hypothetical protein [Rhodoplanes roseus]RAI41077.1 hypothetical protein CH341_22415 [Rhodoplanes roseus]
MKRSTQVGLVLMSALGVGGTAYMLMPGQDCRPPEQQPGLHAPLAPGAAAQPAAQNCAPRGSSGSSSGGYRSSWWHGGSAGQGASSTGSTQSAVRAAGTSSSGLGATLRNGFGSMARGFSSGG